MTIKLKQFLSPEYSPEKIAKIIADKIEDPNT
jgi:hypothetical protein